MVASLIILILICLIAGTLAIQVAEESVIILRVKQWLFLVQPYNKSLTTLSKFSTWRRMLGTIFYILLPLVFCFIVLLRLHALLADLLDCSKCTSFHFTWILLYFAAGFPLVVSLVLAPLGILAVYLINLIK